MTIKTRERVSSFGEVFTSQNTVNAMLDLVYTETQRIDSRFFEPACGNGNFLVEVLERKLDVVEQRYQENQTDYEHYAFQAVGSIYGVEILTDNVHECRERLLSIITNTYNRLYKHAVRKPFLDTIRFVLSRNIIWGDVLTLTEPRSEIPITFSEWNFTLESSVKRVDYTLDKLLACQPMEGKTLFFELGDQAFIPKPKREFPPVHYLEVGNFAEE